MRICMVVYDMQEFGGLEEIAVTLAISLKEKHHDICVLSTAWVPSNNQYRDRLIKNKVTFVQLPKWLSHLASHWPTKEMILATIMKLLKPLVYLLGGILVFVKRRAWKQSRTSAHNWIQGWLGRIIVPDQRKPLVRLLLNWWRLYWHPDLIHVQGYTSTLLFVVEWAHSKKMPLVYVENQTPSDQFDWWKEFPRSINKATMVVAPSEKSAQTLRSVAGVMRPIAIFNPNVADPMANEWQRNWAPQSTDKTIRVTTIARLYVTKGLTYLLQAISQIKQTHPSVKFKIFGDGPLRQDLFAYASQLGLDGNQIFAGAFTHQELPAIMAQTDIFAVSSILEGQPLTVVEAMAYGRPIVATTVGGISEMIEDGVNGLICQPKDPDCLTNKIRMLIEDPILRQKLGRAARSSYEQGPFHPSAVCDCFISIYKQVLREATP